MRDSDEYKLDFILKDLRTSLKVLFISTTNRCNLNCIHCGTNAGSNGNEFLSEDQLRNIIQKFALAGGREIVLTGGEPLLRKDFLETITFAIDQNLGVSVETNGILLKRKLVNRLSALADKIHFCISLDGYSSESHDWFRKKPGAFLEVIKNIEYCLSKNFLISVSTILHRKNIHEIEGLTNYLLYNLSVHHRLVPYISKFGRGILESGRDAALSNKEVLAFLKKTYYPLYRKALENKKDSLLFIDLPKAILPDYVNFFSNCGWGLSMAGINTEGQFGICHRTTKDSRFTIPGNDSTQGLDFKHAFHQHQTFTEVRDIDRSNLKGICSNCKFNLECRGHCRLLAYHIYNDIYAPYPVCQNLYREGLFPNKSMIDKSKKCDYSQT